MGRRPIDVYTRSRIGVLRGEGKKLDEIWFLVKDGSTGLPERRTVARYLKMYDENIQEESSWNWLADTPTNKISDLQFLLECKHAWDTKLITDTQIGQFSERIAKWCWLINRTYRKFSYNDLFSIASLYAHEERIASIEKLNTQSNSYIINPNLKINNVLNFLNGLLVYNPWKSKQRRLEFIEAVNSGTIEFPYLSGDWSIFAHCIGVDNEMFNWQSPKKIVPFPPPVFGSKTHWYMQLKKLIG
tara:strand:+ start:1340 stop:2071 length:732 start_codon:yes stop_codon:yes gene_type:complete